MQIIDCYVGRIPLCCIPPHPNGPTQRFQSLCQQFNIFFVKASSIDNGENFLRNNYRYIFRKFSFICELAVVWSHESVEHVFLELGSLNGIENCLGN